MPTTAERAGDFTAFLTGNSFSPCDLPGQAAPVTDPHFDTGTIFDPYSTATYNCQNVDPSTNQPVVVSLRQPLSYKGQVNVIDPARINQVGSNIANFYPAPTSGDQTQNYLANQDHVNDQNAFDVRVDQRFNESNQVFGSYSFSDRYADVFSPGTPMRLPFSSAGFIERVDTTIGP